MTELFVGLALLLIGAAAKAFALPLTLWVAKTWMRLCTLGLSPKLRDLRIGEKLGDLHDRRKGLEAKHHEPPQVALCLLCSLIRGAYSDVTWRFGGDYGDAEVGDYLRGGGVREELTALLRRWERRPAIVRGVGLVAEGGLSAVITGTITWVISSNNSSVPATLINVLLFLIGVVAVVMIVIGGFRYVVSGGNSGAITSAKNTILYASIGIVVAILGYATINFIVKSFL